MLREWLLAWHRAIWFPLNWMLGLEARPAELPMLEPRCPEIGGPDGLPCQLRRGHEGFHVCQRSPMEYMTDRLNEVRRDSVRNGTGWFIPGEDFEDFDCVAGGEEAPQADDPAL